MDLKDLRLRIFSFKKNLIPPRPLPNFEIQKYYQNAPRFNGFCSRDNLPKKIKNRAHVINLDKFIDVETHCRCNTFGCFVQY